jgi:hypothetical protein
MIIYRPEVAVSQFLEAYHSVKISEKEISGRNTSENIFHSSQLTTSVSGNKE